MLILRATLSVRSSSCGDWNLTQSEMFCHWNWECGDEEDMCVLICLFVCRCDENVLIGDCIYNKGGGLLGGSWENPGRGFQGLNGRWWMDLVRIDDVEGCLCWKMIVSVDLDCDRLFIYGCQWFYRSEGRIDELACPSSSDIILFQPKTWDNLQNMHS